MRELNCAVIALCATFASSPARAQGATSAHATRSSTADSAMASAVRREFVHAWSGYKRYAWGHDELLPLSKGYHDWYGRSLLMTPVDALDTMILMGLTDEAREARELIDTTLSFDQDIYVKNFEITIRLLGGLLSGYQLSGDKRLLTLAQDLGTRLLPVFDSPTGMPYVEVNLRTGKVRNPHTNPAEVGTLLLEFGTLSRLTGNPVFYDKAKRAVVTLYARRSPLGLVGSAINVETGVWSDSTSHIGGGIDSYYEYLLKAWLLFGDQDCKRMWEASARAVNQQLSEDVSGAFWYGQANMYSGARLSHHFTGDERYREMGRTFLRDLIACCRTDVGYAALSAVRTRTQRDSMESYFLAETLKYLYLLFAAPDAVNLRDHVFNTEAHPLAKIAR